MAWHRRRPMWDDFEYDYEWDLRHEEYRRSIMYDMAYRRRMRELEWLDRMQEWELAQERWDRSPFEREDRMRMQELDMTLEGRGLPPFERGKDAGMEGRNLPPFEGREDFCVEDPKEWEDQGEEAWNIEGRKMEAEKQEWHAELDKRQDLEVPEDGAGQKDMEEEDDEFTEEEKRVFKLKRFTCIPLCYYGPFFDSKFTEFIVTVSPITLFDIWNPNITGITTNASSFKLVMGTKKRGQYTDSSLILMAKDFMIRNLMRGIMKQNFNTNPFSIKVEQQEAGKEKIDEDEEFTIFPTVIHTASFKINNSKLIREHANRATTSTENWEDKQSALKLHNLPKKVEWTFLRLLFPFCVSGQIIEGESRSCLVEMKSSKMALLHQVCITGLQVDGQPIQMDTDVPPQEAVQFLREAEDDTSPALDMPKPKKKLSPSYIRRNIKKKQEYAERMARFAHLPHAPPFPGVSNLLNMSFSGPGNRPVQNWPTASVSGSAAGGEIRPTHVGIKASNTTAGTTSDNSETFPDVPIPQILEGPYPPVAAYYAPGTPSAPGTSQKVRTPGYFRRRGARVAVHQAHLWGGNLELAGKALERAIASEDQKKPVVIPPPHMLSIKPLTVFQLQRLRKKVREKPSMDEMRKAEEHWQRKRKEREATGRTIVRKIHPGVELYDSTEQKSETKIERDRQRMAEYNEKKQMQHVASQQTASKNTGVSSQAGSWNMQKATNSVTANDMTQGKPAGAKQCFFQPPPAPKQPQPPQIKRQYQDNRFQRSPGFVQPPPGAGPVQSPQNVYSQTSFQQPTQPSQNQFVRPPPPRPVHAFQTSKASSVHPVQNEYTHRDAQLSQTRFSHAPSVPSPHHHYSQPPSSGSASRPFAQQSQYQQNSSINMPEFQQQGSGYMSDGQSQQQRWEPAAAARGQEYSQSPSQQYTSFWQRGGVLNPEENRQDSAPNQQSGMHQQHYSQGY